MTSFAYLMDISVRTTLSDIDLGPKILLFRSEYPKLDKNKITKILRRV